MLTQNDIYPTRGDQERLTERKDPILYGWDHCHKRLSESELMSYERNGFVIVPDVFSNAEIACFNRRLSNLKQKNNLEKRRYWRQNVPPGECESLFAPEKASRLFRNLAQERRILDRVQQILGSPLYLHRSRIHIEDGVNGTSYPWHSEFETWHAEDGVPRMRGAEAWIMLSESTPTNGAMRILAKSHHIYAACQGNARADAEPAEDSERFARPLARPSFETLTRLFYFGQLVDVYGKPGTLVICDSNLMYGSSRSHESRPRMTAMFSYNSTENLPVGRPFAGGKPRPSPLVSNDFTPLKPQTFNFEQEPPDELPRTFERPPARPPRRRIAAAHAVRAGYGASRIGA